MKLDIVNYYLDIYTKRSIHHNPKSSRYIRVAYANVKNKLYELNAGNITAAHIESLNITDLMKNKLSEIIKIKPDKIILKQIKNDKLRKDLLNIPGIGKKSAEKLINMGIKSANELKKSKWRKYLTTTTLSYLTMKPLKLIPYANIKKIHPKLTAFPNSQIVGGFLRKKKFSKDIDVMISSSNPNILVNYTNYLRKIFKFVSVYSRGSKKMSLIICDKLCYKLDVFSCLPKHKPSMLLYSTGSKEFNIKMRADAKRKGYLLNQYGLFSLKTKKKIPIKTEKGFFNKLDMTYVEPHNR